MLSAQNWPSFRGANASGVADGKPTAVKWNAATGENVAVEDAGRRASPSRARSCGAIACSSRPPSAATPSRHPHRPVRRRRAGRPTLASTPGGCVALDKRTGKVVWDEIAYEGIPKTKRHPKSSQASATPVTDGRHVIVSFGSEGLFAYDFDGKLLWKRDLGVLNSGWFYDPDYEWGIGSSPIIWKNMVIVQCDIQKNSFIAAFDVATGEPIWRTAREEIPSWSTPTIFEHDGRAELVTQATTFTRGYDPVTGKELWRLGGNSEIAIPTPIVGPGVVIVTNGYRGVQPIFAIKPGASGDITLKGDADDRATFIAWSTNARRSVHPDAGHLRRSALRAAEQRRARDLQRRDRRSASTRSGWADRRLVQRLAGRRRRQGLSHERRRRRLRRQGGPDLRAARDEPDRRGAHGHAGDLGRRASSSAA